MTNIYKQKFEETDRMLAEKSEQLVDLINSLLDVEKQRDELIAVLEIIVRDKADWDSASPEMELDGIKLIASIAIEKYKRGKL